MSSGWKPQEKNASAAHLLSYDLLLSRLMPKRNTVRDGMSLVGVTKETTDVIQLTTQHSE